MKTSVDSVSFSHALKQVDLFGCVLASVKIEPKGSSED